MLAARGQTSPPGAKPTTAAQLTAEAKPTGVPGDATEWSGCMAAGVIVIVPSLIFFLVASGRIARGLPAGAVKS